MSDHSRTSASSGAPGALTRVVYFALGALIGGVIGYGFVSSGPEPAPSIFEAPAAAWVFGLAAVCGALGAISPGGIWRRSRTFSIDRDRNDP